MNLTLSADLAELVRKQVESGEYPSANEVVRAASWLLDERDRLYRMRLEELRREAAVGPEQADRGELLDGPMVFAQLRAEIEAMRPVRGA